MIYVESVLNVKDNSGVTFVKCLKVLGKNPRKYGKIGDLLVVSIQNVKPSKKLTKGGIYKAILIQTKKSKRRNNGHFVNFKENVVILVNDKLVPYATRSKNVSIYDFKNEKFSKLNSILWSAL